MVAADERTPVIFSLSSGQAHDAPEGRKLLSRLGVRQAESHLLMDSAYEGDATRQLAIELGYSSVVPPRRSRIVPWKYDEELYKRRNEVERLFRRLKGFRRIFTRYDKLDELYIGFILFAAIFDALRSVV
jgi:transposase